jgi:hypothetical protein
MLNNKSIYTIDKILTTVGFIFVLIASIIIAITPPASKYEVSIYTVYPAYFWVFVGTGIILGVVVLVRNAFTSDRPSHGWAFLGLGMIMIFNLIIMLLPVFRGYYVSDLYDEIGHIGMIKDIVLTGHIGASNFYPVPHILTLQISSITGSDYLLVYKFILPLFYIVFILGLFLLARELSQRLRVTFLVMAFASPMLFTYFNYLFLPTQMSLYLLPMVLFLLFKHIAKSNLQYSILFFILLFMLPFLHPMGSLFSVVIFLILGISSLIVKFRMRRNLETDNQQLIDRHIILPSTAILFILFFNWFSRSSDFNFYIQNFIASFEAGASPMQSMINRQAEVNFALFYLVKMVVLNYGQAILFSLLTAIGVAIVFRKLLLKNSVPRVAEISFSLIFLFFGSFYFATLLLDFMTTGRSIRIFCWALTASFILNGLVFFDIIDKFKKLLRIACISIVILIIGISAVNGLFNVYESPIIRMANLQATKANIDGMDWLLINRGTAHDTASIDSLKYLEPGYIQFGWDSNPYPQTALDFVPDYFGYDKYGSIKDAVNTDTYIPINQRDREIIKYSPDSVPFTLNNLNQLQNDPGVKRIYFNGDLEILEVLSPANE